MCFLKQIVEVWYVKTRVFFIISMQSIENKKCTPRVTVFIHFMYEADNLLVQMFYIFRYSPKLPPSNKMSVTFIFVGWVHFLWSFLNVSIFSSVFNTIKTT